MSQLIKDQKIIEDVWQVFDPEAENAGELPTSGNLMVPYVYWLANQAELSKREGQTSPILDGELDFLTVMDEAGDALLALDMIALDFPAFKDGRCYSFARLLRDRYDYQGELRAIGDILQDQVFPMARCGINAFVIREDRDAQAALTAFDDFTVKYQPASDEPLPLFRRFAA